MKIVLAFDSFKGNMTAQDACEIAARGIQSVRPDVETVVRPMADGGEGTAEALMSALGGEWIPMTVTGPFPHMRVEAGYAWLPETKTAVVEMAKASGLPLLKPEVRNPVHATTYGTGELIKAAAEKGAQKILLTVGGSATVDGGIGAAEALGWKIVPGVGITEPPAGLNLPEMDVLCDVTNPLCGPNGAAYVYGPQKGATPEQVKMLDSKLWKLSETVFQTLEVRGAEPGVPLRDLPGAGAAGGLAFGAVAFMNGKLVPGIDTVMETLGLADALRGADWVLTGEGKLDMQSVQGKVVDGVQRLAKRAGARTGVIAGCVRLTEPEWRIAGIDRVATLQPAGMSVEESIARSRDLLFEEAATFAGGL
ncbi:glycerate kinase [Tichowtungia aerotolerans]|uniref:Glycerate kinase n=1 Tax=Tichowtungia aerotolerans TaxID=2697043 RepID=A0A6P1MB69_9BACT|nr:glycerate kinase [Tichowtungia aerotolerans]QHI68806.1 glycerate kinase [Tichowtungia aerotolerans]